MFGGVQRKVKFGQDYKEINQQPIDTSEGNIPSTAKNQCKVSKLGTSLVFS